MQLVHHIKISIANLAISKLRTLLAMLGILVGTAAVVALVSCANLATEQTLAQIKNLGTNLFAISLYDNNTGNDFNNSANIDLQTALAAKNTSNNIVTIAPYTNIYLPVVYQSHILNASIVGVTQELQDTLKITLFSGRFISFLDHYVFYCVIGQTLYQNLLAINSQNPLGKQITLGNAVFTIIGIANSWPENNFFNEDVNQAILIPIDISFVLSQSAKINNIVLQIQPNANIDHTEAALIKYFNYTAPNKQLFFRSAKEIIQSMQKQRAILTLLLGFIGSIALFVGGIGIMNIMLVTVTERRREIGIRRALGATRNDIQVMFLIEATILSILGGILGIIVGIFISLIISEYAHWHFIIYITPSIVAFTVSVLVGIFFGFYPARNAAQLDPIETLQGL